MLPISAPHLADSQRLAQLFNQADPFRHLVIDDFFTRDFADRLLVQFPAFERGNALNENGQLGGKSVVERVRELGDAYAALDDMVRSPAFLQWLSQATGIPDLRYDPWYFGGGTHENRQGQDLDPHIDFNRHPETGWHRRLNLIVYLNHQWDDAWGGSLELHSDPRSPDDRVSLVTPLFNRCVVFETTEWSWHGFSRIQLPEDQQQLSRRSVALYFYTTTRPEDELADTHSTVYVDRPLSDRFQPGMVLNETDLAEIRTLLARRDMHNQRLYNEVCRLQSLVGGGGNGSQLGRFLHGCKLLVTQREGRASERIKRAFVPFVTHLPVSVRDPLRRFWRWLNGRSLEKS